MPRPFGAILRRVPFSQVGALAGSGQSASCDGRAYLFSYVGASSHAGQSAANRRGGGARLVPGALVPGSPLFTEGARTLYAFDAVAGSRVRAWTGGLPSHFGARDCRPLKSYGGTTVSHVSAGRAYSTLTAGAWLLATQAVVTPALPGAGSGITFRCVVAGRIVYRVTDGAATLEKVALRTGAVLASASLPYAFQPADGLVWNGRTLVWFSTGQSTVFWVAP